MTEHLLIPIDCDPPGEFIRIVIADYHRIFRDCLRQLLTLAEGFRVVAEARNGQQVLEVVEKHQPDILLLELKMDGLDGLTVLQELQHCQSKTKTIVLTAWEDKNHFVQAMKFGARGIVLKRTASELLIKSIRKVHAGEIWLDSHAVAVMRQFSSSTETAPLAVRGQDLFPLSPREREIVALVAQGFSNSEVAGKMFITEQSVKNHLHNIFDKLGVSDRLELALYAISHEYRRNVMSGCEVSCRGRKVKAEKSAHMFPL